MKDLIFTNDDQITLVAGLNHYSQSSDFKDSKKWALEWIKQHIPDEFERLQDAKEHLFSNRGFVCRMIERGFKVSDDQRQALVKFFKNIVTNKTTKNEITEMPKRLPAERVNEVIFQLEDIIDQILADEEPNQLKLPVDKAQLTAAQSWIEQQMVDAQEMVAKHQAILDQLENAYTRCGGVKDKIVSQAKSSKVKKSDLTAEKAAAAKSMKYQKKDDELKIESLSPARIVGAKEVMVFNTKYRTLTHYVAEEGKTLKVSHSSIRNADAKTSVSKKIRKPDEFFSSKDIWKAYGLVKTTAQAAKSLVSECCLIVAVK